MARRSWHWVADDISRWDTRISVAELRMECQFLQDLAGNDEDYKEDIRAVYRLYANKVIAINRPSPDGRPGHYQRAFYRLRGQRGSGEIVTYVMNTMTNAALQYARYAAATGMPVSEIADWVARQCRAQARKNDTGVDQPDLQLSILLSGDDSCVALPADNAAKFADAHKFFSAMGRRWKAVGCIWTQCFEPSSYIETVFSGI